MDRADRLLHTLADGEPHSGEGLGAVLGVTRAAVWKLINQLREQGVPIRSVRRRGYRLEAPMELLDVRAMRSEMSAGAARALGALAVERVVDSTNRRLFAELDQLARPRALLAEAQSAGRGRRGRSWHSPFGRNLYLSIAWPFEAVPGGVGGLSLATGIAVADELSRYKVSGLGLKWPNDLLIHEAKVGGILVELQGEPEGPCAAVIGLGLNLQMDDAGAVDQPWTALCAHLAFWPGRNVIAGGVLNAMILAMQRFQVHGFAGFAGDWARHDLLAGRQVRLHVGSRTVDGLACGVDQTGCLLLDQGQGPEPWRAGEVSLRSLT
ncbi:bifunctional biotin--[acetyl-CoA-carboxylase] ligase/biotin operon repressor BirA [Aquisalimonas sp.]|uniref:bifunctional biotin--[acetyl-CoA-carboxylase] ligase/biotin operon repressor BirA n=1 Tax=Aquisalimonas sp. TaxID=1872621 RepID=UPI0025C26103|nr:bifunctional biotin--[acetyl-CoA-carboxylase] ligase/biotin operon repressor BirA [Aquisalimonas sp.]